MVLPEVVYGLQHDNTFQVSEIISSNCSLLFIISLDAKISNQLRQSFPGQPVQGVVLQIAQAEIKLLEDRFVNPFPVPFFSQGPIIDKKICDLFSLFTDHVFNGWFQTFATQSFTALPVDNFTLLIHDIIIF